MAKILTVNKLKLLLDTNIPNKKEPILFTRNILYNPISNTNSSTELPFFNTQYKYPKYVLNNLSYDKCIQFFFDKKIFIEMLNTYIVKESLSPAITPEEIKDIIDFNINTMVELLFPTKYPNMNNYDSYSNNILEIQPGLSFKGSLGVFEQILPNNLRTNYSYINIDNKKYTIVKTTILNDIFNHPGYSKMIESYNKINLKKMESNIQKKIKNIIEKFFILMSKMRKHNYFNELIQILQKVLDNEMQEEQRVRYKIDVVYITEYIKLLNIIRNTGISDDESNINNMETMTYKTEKISTYIPTKISKIIKEIKETLDKYELLNTIRKKHLLNGMVNIDFDKNVSGYMKENYKNYYNFGKELLNYNDLKSTNYYFQIMLDDFINGNSYNRNYFSEYMKTITQIINGKTIPKNETDLINIFYVGLRYYDDDNEYDDVYECYVKIDVFGGVLTDNINIGCKYNGEALGNYLENTINQPIWKVKTGIFIDIDNITKIQSQQQPNKKKGGKKYTQRRDTNNNNNNTRKKYT